MAGVRARRRAPDGRGGGPRRGLFARAGEPLERLPGSPVALLAASIALVVVVTAVLNLDTAVVFLTPVLVLAARARGLDEQPFAGALRERSTRPVPDPTGPAPSACWRCSRRPG